MYNYKEIFNLIESSLINYSSFTKQDFKNKMKKFKNYGKRNLKDNDYYKLLVEIIFHSGFKAETLKRKLKTIFKYFNNFENVANYDKNKIELIKSDPDMIKNKAKIKACVENAKVFKNIILRYGSFKKYIDFFNPEKSFENLMLLKEELKYRLYFIGDITVYHFIMEIGLPVIKPGRVITRIFKRFGFN